MGGFYQNINLYKDLPFQIIVYNENTNEDLHFYPKHWHHHLEICATIQGKGKAWIDGHEYDIRNNNVFVVNENVLHQIEGYAPYNQNRGYCLQIDLSYFYSLLPMLKRKFHSTCSEELSKRMINELVLLEMDLNEGKDNFELLIRILKILKILNEQRSNDIPLIETDKYKHLLLNIAKYIENHYDESLSVRKIAEHFQLSESYLHKLFKMYFKQSLHQYIMERRMLHAIDDLKYTDFPILDIALKNGFSSNKTFTKEFKKRFNITPLIYRKKRENENI